MTKATPITLPAAGTKRSVIAEKDSHILTLKLALGFMGLLVVLLFIAFLVRLKDVTVRLPPDARGGVTQKLDEVPAPFVYDFALGMFQRVNHWPKDGSDEYLANIESLVNYLTPACYADRKADYEKRIQSGGMDELNERARSVQEIPGRVFGTERVVVESHHSWYVLLDLKVSETYRGQPVKDALVRFPLRVVRYDVNPDLNPYGLALDCFAGEPERLILVAATPAGTP